MIQSFLSMLSILFLWSQWSVQSKLRSAVSSLTWPWCTVQSPVKCSGLLWSSHYTTILAITEIIRSSLSPGYISQFLCPLSLVWYYPTQAWLCETLTLGLWLPKQDLVILGKNLTLSLSLCGQQVFKLLCLLITGSLTVAVTTVFQCIGGIFKILLNIPRLGSSQQVDTAVSDSATPNKERDFFLVASSVECSAGLPSCIETEPSQCESEPKVQEEKNPSGVVFNMSWRLKQKRQLLLAVEELVLELSSPQPEGLTLTTKLGASQDNQHSLTTFALK